MFVSNGVFNIADRGPVGGVDAPLLVPDSKSQPFVFPPHPTFRSEEWSKNAAGQTDRKLWLVHLGREMTVSACTLLQVLK